MPELLLSLLFKLYRLPVGHRLYATRKTRELVLSDREPLSLVDATLLENRTRFVEQRNLKPTWPVKVVELDQEHDRLFSCFERVVSGMEDGPAGAPTTLAAARFRRSLFAGGLTSLIQLDFVQQREQTQTTPGDEPDGVYGAPGFHRGAAASAAHAVPRGVGSEFELASSDRFRVATDRR